MPYLCFYTLNIKKRAWYLDGNFHEKSTRFRRVTRISERLIYRNEMNFAYLAVAVMSLHLCATKVVGKFSMGWLTTAKSSINPAEILRRIQARLPMSECRQSLIAELSIQNCEDLSSAKLTNLAIAATNCHLADSGLPKYYCNFDDYTSCTKNMKTNNDFSTFTAFKLDIERICDSLERSNSIQTATEIISAIQSSQAKSQEKIHVMSDAMSGLTNTLASILDTHKSIEDGLKTSLGIEEKLLQTQTALTEHSSLALTKLKDESETVNSKIFLGQKKIHEQLKKLDHLSSSIDDRLEPMLSMMHSYSEHIFMDVMAAKSVVFYIMFAIAGYVLTIPPATRAVRIRIGVLVASCVAIESIALRPLLAHLRVDPDRMYQVLSFWRSLVVVMALLTLCEKVYRDFHRKELSQEDGKKIIDHMHQLTNNARFQQQLLLKGLINQVTKWRAKHHDLVIDDETLQQVLQNSLPPGYDNNDEYDEMDDDNVPEARSTLYTVACDDTVDGPLQISDIPYAPDGFEVFPYESFAPGDYGNTCNGSHMLKERRMQSEALFVQ